MSVDTYGAVLFNSEPTIEQTNEFLDRIRELVDSIAIREETGNPWRKPKVKIETSFMGKTMSVKFFFNVLGESGNIENRILLVTAGGCQCDLANSETLPQDKYAFWLSFGFWGESKNLMRLILAGLENHCESAWIDYNDCDDEDYVEIDYDYED